MIENLTEYLAENVTENMLKQLNLFGIVLLINFLIVLVYWLWNIPFRRKGDRKSFVICGIVMLLCPLAGPFFFGMAQLFYRAFFFDPVDLDGVIFSKERVRTFIRADEESERNMVPLEEAIEVANTDELRNLMMNIVRGDIQKSLATIALALNSEDTETAHYAASVLQDALNPASPDKAEKLTGRCVFRVGDKVMQIKNNYQQEWERLSDGEKGLGVFNGDVGFITEIDNRAQKVSVVFDDKLVLYDFLLLDELELAYAVTVHKSQGSEFDVVVMPMAETHRLLMTRNLLYTAITRAKHLVVLVGQEEYIKGYVDNDNIQRRFSGLKDKLQIY